ncbi:unnamed protein product [Diatraea saccharalis]|uniref:Uncharacterized protein n=1 Tax=Diatraea saccharalis TaxID=40085 RepID=A0A9N9RBF2_9NEOP|nr:unnamed protein product [Diatraea saccharalis]
MYARAHCSRWLSLHRCTVTRMSYTRQREVPVECMRITAPSPPTTMAARAHLAELPPHPGASPGLLRRRYSVPETIMRKYRLAQQRSDSEESGPGTSPSPASGTPARGSCSSLCEAAQTARGARREREQVRRSALLRRLWGRGCVGTCSCDSHATRSLGGSHAELRPLTSPSSSRHSHAGWATPKRQRLDSSREFRGSDEMIRAAMRNSYDRTEEARYDRLHRIELAESTYTERCTPFVNSATDPLTDCDTPFDVRCERNGFVQYSEQKPSNTALTETESEIRNDRPPSGLSALKDDYTYTDSSDQFSTCTTKETNGSVPGGPSKMSQSAHIDGRISERSVSVENDDNNLLPYNTPLTVDTPSYELLEIVVSETSTANNNPAVKNNSLNNNNTVVSKIPQVSQKIGQNINIDEYVSNILVESLNSLTDQLECMNASIGDDRKINIVEKEIKVKLQNTGVNTIVHLSPTSNNQIIFGNEELYNNDGRKDVCDDSRDGLDVIGIRDETASMESVHNNNQGATSRVHDAVNEAVLQQIQKLFQDELNNLDAKTLYPPGEIPGISHIEISNVDVYIDNNSGATFGNGDGIEMHTRNADDLAELIGGIGTGNYYEDLENGATVPRFSAFPHTSSMEVNASSSDDADAGGSDCMSLVDSLDDPNSPRSLLLRRTFDINARRSELVRSAIDVLDLLPEDALKDHDGGPKEKGESFFIRIKDDDCDCEKENVVVADHMPEKIKQRLYRRHRRRELRMECARRARPMPARRPTARLDRDCRALLDALVDDLIVKIAHEEYKCMRIKQRASRMVSESGESTSKKCSEKNTRYVDDKETFKITRHGSIDTTKDRVLGTKKSEKRHIRGKLSLSTKPSPDDRGPKRIYQKSEIHEGNKCIEILEILEYVTGSRSSSETTNSDENCIHNCKVKKSRIPVPVDEKNQRKSKDRSKKNYWSEGTSSPPMVPREESKTANSRSTTESTELSPESEQNRRPLEPRSRSNSLRFRRIFDSIPEEKSSISVDSSNEDINHNRRASAPNVIENLNYRLDQNGNGRRRSVAIRGDEWTRKETTRTSIEKRSMGTSPPANIEEQTKTLRLRSQTTMTSPQQRSAATSPMRSPRAPPTPVPSRPPRCVRPSPGIVLACTHPPPPLSHRTASVSVE